MPFSFRLIKPNLHIGNHFLLWVLWLGNFPTWATDGQQQKLTYPSDGLIYQNFDHYPRKKGSWYGANISSLELKACPESAFRSGKGLLVSGLATHKRVHIRIPLNPSNSARKIAKLGAHRIRALLRSSHNGRARYRLGCNDGKKLNSNWIKVSKSSTAAMSAKRPTPWAMAQWSSNWQHLEFPEINEVEPLFSDGQNRTVFAKAPFTPDQIEFVLSDPSWDEMGSHPFTLHLDEVALDIEYMLNYRKPWFKKGPVLNLFPRPDFPVNAFHFGPSEKWGLKNLTNREPDWAKMSLSSQGRPVLSWHFPVMGGALPTALLSFCPRTPIHIPTNRGVVGLRVTLRSTGIVNQRLKLNFKEEKKRTTTATSKQSPEHETFATTLPLDFKGVRSFEVPLNFIGLPLRDEFRKHNKIIDGHLEFLSFELVSCDTDHQTNSAKGELEFIRIQQWVDMEKSDLWASPRHAPPTPAPIPSKFKNPTLSSSVLRDFETQTFNQPVFSSSTKTTKVNVNADLALRGYKGAGITLEATQMKAHLQATLMMNLKRISCHEPLYESQCQLLICSTRKSFVQLIVKDHRGDHFLSGLVKVPYLKSSSFLSDHPRRHLKPVSFPLIKAKRSQWTYMGRGLKRQLQLPVKVAGFQLSAKACQKVAFRFDHLTAIDHKFEHDLRLKRLMTENTYLYDQHNSKREAWLAFKPEDSWGVVGLDGFGGDHITMKSATKAGAIQDLILANLSRAQKKLTEAKDKLALLKKLDPHHKKGIKDFWNDRHKRVSLSERPSLVHVFCNPNGLHTTVRWNAPPKLNEWEVFGASSVKIQGFSSSQPHLYIPVEDPINAIIAEFSSSAFPGTSVAFIFSDNNNNRIKRSFSLADGRPQKVAFKLSALKNELESKAEQELKGIRLAEVRLERQNHSRAKEGIQSIQLKRLRFLRPKTTFSVSKR